MDIQALRQEIDTIDDQLVRLFCQRMAVAAKIADYKKQQNLPIHHPGRELEVIQNVGNLAEPELESYTKELYFKIFELSKDYQTERNNCG